MVNQETAVYQDMSNPEKEVAQLLTEIGVWWNYEQPVYVTDERGRPRVWTPDFYLPELGIYIEVCGTDSIDYTYRQDIYRKNRIPIFFIHVYKRDKWRKYLVKEIEHIHRERDNLVKTMVQKAEKL